MSCFCYSTVRSTNSKTSAARPATVNVAPAIAKTLARRRGHGRVLAYARIASSRSASQPTISGSIEFTVAINAWAYASVAEQGCCVFVADVRVTTFHTLSKKTNGGVASPIGCHSGVSLL